MDARNQVAERNIRTLMAALPMLAGALAAPAAVYRPGIVHDVDLLDSGNLLVTDGGTLSDHDAGGVYEIDRAGNIVWSYTTGLRWAHNADRQDDGSVIISDTDHDRVIIVDAAGAIVWNTDDLTFSDGSHLDYPNDANLLDDGHRLITDRNNHRVIEIDASGNIVWQFGQTGVPGGDATHLNGPHNADRLPDGHTLIADSNNARIVEVAPDGTIVWTCAGGLSWPRDADRLPGGNTLIDDSNNHRVIEVTPAGAIAWSFATSSASYDADRLPDGHTLIGDGDRIIEVDPAGTIVWSYPQVYETEIVEGYLVTAPNGSRLWTRIIQPRHDLYAGERFPAVVQVPGGLSPGEDGDLHVAADGFVEFHFNAEGRGTIHPSDGVENQNGFADQDDLKAVIEFALALPNVQTDNLGVVTGSYGITMGAGCLGRYPALPVKYLIDQEGPSDSFVTCYEPWALDDDPSNDRHVFAHDVFGHWSLCRDPSPANEAWWSQREATRYIGNIRCRYLRLQAEWDHAQPPNAAWPGFDYWPCEDDCSCWYPDKHAIDLVNLATLGRSPWTRVNGPEPGNASNALYDHDHPPVWYAGRMSDHPGVLTEAIYEMAGMPPLAPPGDLDGDNDIDLADLALLLSAYLACEGDAAYNPDADLNGSGCVDLADLSILLAGYGFSG